MKHTLKHDPNVTVKQHKTHQQLRGLHVVCVRRQVHAEAGGCHEKL